MDTKRNELTAAGVSAAQADFIVKRKLTCRMIAQWAINCVDARDSDAIMTPFEYDENPWDGWGTLGRDGKNIPLDGDPATDENGDAANNIVNVIDWDTVKSTHQKAFKTVRSAEKCNRPDTRFGLGRREARALDH